MSTGETCTGMEIQCIKAIWNSNGSISDRLTSDNYTEKAVYLLVKSLWEYNSDKKLNKHVNAL